MTLDLVMISWKGHQEHKQQKKTQMIGLDQNLELLCIRGNYQGSEKTYDKREKIFANHGYKKISMPKYIKNS